MSLSLVYYLGFLVSDVGRSTIRAAVIGLRATGQVLASRDIGRTAPPTSDLDCHQEASGDMALMARSPSS